MDRISHPESYTWSDSSSLSLGTDFVAQKNSGQHKDYPLLFISIKSRGRASNLRMKLLRLKKMYQLTPAGLHLDEDHVPVFLSCHECNTYSVRFICRLGCSWSRCCFPHPRSRGQNHRQGIPSLHRGRTHLPSGRIPRKKRQRQFIADHLCASASPNQSSVGGIAR